MGSSEAESKVDVHAVHAQTADEGRKEIQSQEANEISKHFPKSRDG